MPEQVIDNMDWIKLAKQKQTLLKVMQDTSGDQEDDLTGILHLIDHLQDEAVKEGKASEEEVFGTTTFRYLTLRVEFNVPKGVRSDQIDDLFTALDCNIELPDPLTLHDTDLKDVDMSYPHAESEEAPI